MHHAHVTRERIVSREGLLLDAESAPDLLFFCVMKGVFVSRQVIRPGEVGFAWLSSRRVNALALVRASLGVSDTARSFLLVVFTLMLLQFLQRLEAQRTAAVCATVRATPSC